MRRRLLLVFSLSILGCGPSFPTPNPPEGKGWYTFGQGYHDFTVTSTSSSSGSSTTTTTTTTSSYSGVSQHVVKSVDEVRRTLHTGRNVRDYRFNEGLVFEVQQ